MKYSLVAVAAAGIQAAAAANPLNPKDFFPECAVNCITGVLATATTCDPDDNICLCTRANQYKIYNAAEQCVIAACGFDVAQQSALPAAKPYCEAATSLYSATATSPLPTETPRVRSTSSSSSAAATTTSTRQLVRSDYFPECSLNCITSVLGTVTTCDPEDDVCLCTRANQYKIYEASEQCVISACGFDVAQQSVLPAAKPYCSAATSLYSVTATSPLPTETPRVRSTTSGSAAPTSTATRQLVRSDYFPECSLNCITSVLGTVTTCDPEDDVCLCTRANQYKIYEASEQCVISACGFDVAQQTVLAAAKPYCSAATSLYSLTATSPLPTEPPRVRSSASTSAGSATITGTSSAGGKNSTSASFITKTSQSSGAVVTKTTLTPGQLITKTTIVTVTEPCTDASGSTTGYTTKTVSVTRTETCTTSTIVTVPAAPTKGSSSNCETCIKPSNPGAATTPVVVKTTPGSQPQGTPAPSSPAVVVVNGASQVGSMGAAALLAMGICLAL